MNIRTDLALESREMFAGELSGVESENRDSDGISVTHVKITTEEGAQKIGKPIGNYITICVSFLLEISFASYRFNTFRCINQSSYFV